MPICLNKMGEAMVKAVMDGISKPYHDTCLFCCNACTCRSECTKCIPCVCSITTHETGDDEEIDPEGKE